MRKRRNARCALQIGTLDHPRQQPIQRFICRFGDFVEQIYTDDGLRKQVKVGESGP